jgi:hypothetical protein
VEEAAAALGTARLMKVDVRIRGIDELKRERAKLSASVAGRLSRNAAMAAARVIAAAPLLREIAVDVGLVTLLDFEGIMGKAGGLGPPGRWRARRAKQRLV